MPAADRVAALPLPIGRCAAPFLVGLAAASAQAREGGCESLPAGIDRLVLVTGAGFASGNGRLRLFRRSSADASWHAVSPPEPVVLGRHGLAWGHPFRDAARPGEPVKREVDGRTPAGLYRLGRSFGFPATVQPGHLVLRPGRTVCVDDPDSPAYNHLVPVRQGRVAPKGEDMGAEPLYRRGLVIDYPSDAAQRAGSCIFLHVWRGPTTGTAGCVALPERRVAAIQNFASRGAAIAILPETALPRFSACLPRP